MATGLITSAMAHLPPAKGGRLPLSIAMLLFACAFTANLCCGIKFKKMWGKGGLTDSDWADFVLYFAVCAVCLGAAFRIWTAFAPISS